MKSMAKRRSSAAKYKMEVQKTFQLHLQTGTFTKRAFPDLNPNKCVNRLIYGSVIDKITKNGEGKTHPIFFYILEDDLTQLQWISNSKKFRDTRIDLQTVTSISDMPTHAKKKLLTRYQASGLLSVHYGLNSSEELLLHFEDEKVKREWWCGLQYFIEEAQKEYSITKETSNALAKEIFNRADADGTRTLSKSEIRQIFKDLHINIKHQKVSDVFQKYDKNHDGQIDFEEFKIFVKELLRKKELAVIFKDYAPSFVEDDNSSPVMTLDQLQKFFQKEQKQEITLDDVRAFNPLFKDINSLKPCISFDIFNDIIFSLFNTIFCSDNSVDYQDMRRPITDYYINSSHNTYLTGNQITGESSVHAYINALLLGCRCIELDLWNGPNNEPIIYHGHTMTSKIKFEDVVVALKEYAFVKSSYPLILSFEMHCDLKGQKRVSQILRKYIGDMLYVIPSDHSSYDHYPFPEQLKNKFIIKGKGKIMSQDELHKFMNPTSPSRLEAPQRPSKSDVENMEKTDVTKHLSVFDVSIDSQFDLYDNSTDTITDFRMSPNKKFLNRQDSEDILQEDDDALFSISKNRNLSSTLFLDNPPLFIVQPAKSPFSHRIENSRTAPNSIGLNIQKAQTFTTIPMQNRVALLDDSVDDSDAHGISNKMKNLIVNNYFEKSSEMKGHKRHASHEPVTVGQKPLKEFDKALNGSIVDVKQRSLFYTPKKKEEKTTLKVLPELNELYGLIGTKINLKLGRTIWEIASVDEGKIAKLNKHHQKDIVDFHKKYLTRIYPNASRIDSSNFDPIPAWATGSQLVALNFQTHDEALLLNYAKFSSNGGVGYVLKPKYLCHNKETEETKEAVLPRDFKKPLKKLKIQIISGQQIRPDNFKSKEIIDPYVEVRLKGLDVDENANIAYRTQTIKDNGFHPVWMTKEKANICEFNIAAPDFAMVTFTVYDEDMVGRDKIGWYAIEFKNIQQGYRVIPVLGMNFKPINHSYIFCHVSIDDL